MNLLKHLIRGVLHAAGNDGGEGGGGDDDTVTGDDTAGGGDNSTDGGTLAAVEARAREMGWAPKEEWRGNPQHWLDAGEYVQRGEQMIPILRSNLRKTESEVERLRRTAQEQDQKLKAALESIDVLTNISTEQSRNAAKEKRRELLRQRAEARREGNTDAEVDLDEQIIEVTEQIDSMEVDGEGATPRGKQPAGKTKGKAAATAQPAEDDPTQDPDYVSWTKDNPWFGTDARRTALATAIGQEIRSNPANAGLVGRAFFDKVTAEMNKFLGVQQRPGGGGSKVESGGGGGGGGGDTMRTANGKSYNDLPQDAKQACERQAKLVVGEGRAFKDITAWRKHYTTMYFNS